jgi:hypothetical protein
LRSTLRAASRLHYWTNAAFRLARSCDARAFASALVSGAGLPLRLRRSMRRASNARAHELEKIPVS